MEHKSSSRNEYRGHKNSPRCVKSGGKSGVKANDENNLRSKLWSKPQSTKLDDSNNDSENYLKFVRSLKFGRLMKKITP